MLGADKADGHALRQRVQQFSRTEPGGFACGEQDANDARHIACVAPAATALFASATRVGFTPNPQLWRYTLMGRLRTRLPVAAKSALATAGAMTGVPGSPTPVGFSFDGTM